MDPLLLYKSSSPIRHGLKTDISWMTFIDWKVQGQGSSKFCLMKKKKPTHSLFHM